MGNWNSVYAFEYKTMTPAVLKDIMVEAGVHMYTGEESPVYANERLLALHFKTGGAKTVRLPRACSKVVDVLSGKIVATDAAEFAYDFATPDTVLFEVFERREEESD
jgi:hypothetical protein